MLDLVIDLIILLKRIKLYEIGFWLENLGYMVIVRKIQDTWVSFEENRVLRSEQQVFGNCFFFWQYWSLFQEIRLFLSVGLVRYYVLRKIELSFGDDNEERAVLQVVVSIVWFRFFSVARVQVSSFVGIFLRAFWILSIFRCVADV